MSETKLTSELRAASENVQESTRKRFQVRWAMRSALTGVPGVSPRALGASPERPGDAFGRLLAALGSPWAPQGPFVATFLDTLRSLFDTI